MEKKFKVLFFGGGLMGDLVRGVLENLESVNIIEFTDFRDVKEGVMIPVKGYDLIFSASYPSRISQDLCKLTAHGAVNLHTSLLPEGRGSHPLNWALIWGKDKTGITIHKIVDSYDAGDICLQQEVPIFDTDNIVILRERVDMMVRGVVAAFFKDPLTYMKNARQQNQAQMSYAQKRRIEDSELNLSASPEELYNLFRSCHPMEYPAFVMRDGIKTYVKNVTAKGEITYETT